MNSFKLFGFKRKLEVLSPIEHFFEFHSSVTERKKAENSNFLANKKSLNEFNK